MLRAAIAIAFGLPLLAFRQSPDTMPVIRSTTRMVEIDVLVADRQGAVGALTADDFVVTDQGKRQVVKLLELRRAPGNPEGNPEKSPAVSGNTFSNRPSTAAEAAAPTVTILLLDGLNTRFEDQNRAREQAIRALGSIRLGEKDRLAIYVLGKSLRVLSDFVDPQQTRAVLAKYGGRLNTEMSDSAPLTWTVGDPLIDGFLEFTDGLTAQAVNMDRASLTLSALSAIANHAASIPGRKNLIWVTGGLPLPADAIARFLNAANIAVYPLDARGLIGLPPQWTAAAPSGFKKGSGPSGSLAPSGLGTFEDLAAATGGHAWINGNNLGLAVQNALQDSAATYALGFQPDPTSLDGKYHEVRVNLRAKHPGVELRYRQGYVATKDTDTSTDSAAVARLQSALWSPLEASGLALSAKFANGDASHSGSVKLTCTLDAREIGFDSTGGRWTGALDVIIAQQDASSKLMDSSTGQVDLQFNRAEYEQHLAAGVTFFRNIQLQPGLVTLRVLVQDRNSGLIGSLIVPASRIPAQQQR